MGNFRNINVCNLGAFKNLKNDQIWPVAAIYAELVRINRWYQSDGQFYDGQANIVSMGIQKTIVHKSTANQRLHKKGLQDLKSYRGEQPFSAVTSGNLKNCVSCNAFHNSVTEGIDSRAILPPNRPTLAGYRVEELQKMVIDRGGSLKDPIGKNLKKNNLVVLLQ